MATYKEIKGVTLQTKDSDPVLNVGSWASGGDLNQAKKQLGGAGLTPTASIVFGGVQASPPSLGTTESYNGTSWTELNDMPQVTQYLAGVGTSTAAVAIAGIGGPGDSPKGDYIQEWNGSSWSNNPNAYPFAGYSLAGAGTATAAIISGGDPARTDVNTFDGTSFTSSTAMNTGRRGHGSVGTTTANLVFCGETPRTANTELWNGSSWTEVNDYPAATQDLSYWGTSTSAIGALGYDTANSANSASWDGTSWTETADLSTARNGANRGGLGTTNTEGLVAGGDDSGVKSNTEEFGFPPPTAAILTEGDIFLSGNTTLKGFGRAAGIPAATFSSGGTLNNGHGYGGGFGLQTAAICAAGGYPTHTANTESYNGTSWTEVNDLSTARRNVAECGSQSSGVVINGGPPFSANPTSSVEAWDGTSWTAITGTPIGGYSGVGIGTTSTSLLYCGGNNNPGPGGQKLNTALEYNGTSWTSISNMGTTREAGMGAARGSTTAGLMFGGESPSLTVNTELWNGSSWTELNNLNAATGGGGGNGNSTQALCFAGNTPSAPPYQSTKNEFWNGTSWTEINDLATGRSSGIAPAGGGALGLVSGGQSAPGTQSTASEEWTADNALSTVTVS